MVGLVAPAVQAQDGDLEQVLVTGSRIARPDFTSASPIVSVTEELFERSGSPTAESALNTLPQFVPAYTSTSNNPSNGGQANVSLRGLGTTSTLVLLDGKRLMPASGNGVADLNIIPPSLIETVEIITGGASAVYGSDALAGVVNFKLKRKFDGVEIDGTWGQTDRGDGAQYEAGLTAGTDFAGGRGSVVGFVGYADRELVTNADREFSKYGMAYVGPGAGSLGPDNAFVPIGSPVIEEGRANFWEGNAPTAEALDTLMVSYGYAPRAVPYQESFAFNADGTLFTPGAFEFVLAQVPAVANFRYPRDPVFFNEYEYTFNVSPYALQLSLERKSMFVRADFDLGETARVYAQGLYADYSVSVQHAPTPMFGVFLPATNPFIPDDLRFLLDTRPDPDADVDFAKRLSELGPRVSNNQYEVYQATVGVSGEFVSGWQYDAYVQIGANDQTDHQTGNVLTSRIEELTFALDGGVSICGGFNPFGRGSISRECADYVAVDASNHASVDQAIVEASLSGPLIAMPAGDLRVVLGAFYKEDKYQYSASPEASVFLPDGRPDMQGFSAAADIRGDDHNMDLYVETLVPLLAELRGVESLEAVLGYRLSDYESAGSFDSWKAELLYQPMESIRVRSSYQQAVRAPGVTELYLPQLPTFFFFDSFFFPNELEPCEVGSRERTGPDAARVEALCVAQGVPASLLTDFQKPSDFVQGVAGGNPDLGPEEASTTTLGVVWTSRAAYPLLANMQVSLDWYRIDIKNRISDVFFEEFVANCYDARYNPEFSLDSEWCTPFRRDATTGGIVDVQQLLRNAYDWETDGADLQLDWRIDLGPGQLGVNWLLAWVDSVTVGVHTGSVPPEELVGTTGSQIGGSFGVGTSFPEWRSNLYLSYAWRDATVGAGWQYIDAVTDADSTLDPEFRVPRVDYFDLNASYAFSAGLLAGLELSVGVENLTDEDPPTFPSSFGSAQYDVLGRRYFASLRYYF